jgi:hypothetical protein
MILRKRDHDALVQGNTVRVTSASDMLADLAGQDGSVALARRLRRYALPSLLCIDEVGTTQASHSRMTWKRSCGAGNEPAVANGSPSVHSLPLGVRVGILRHGSVAPEQSRIQRAAPAALDVHAGGDLSLLG